MKFSDWWTRLRRRPARSPKRTPCVLRLESLEERTLPATINWIAGSGNFDDGANWSGGVVPGRNDVAVIDTGFTAATVTIQDGDNLQVQAINTASADTLAFTGVFVDSSVVGPFFSSGALTVTAGSSTLNGPLSIAAGSLTATGSSASLTANGTTTFSNGSIGASGGAQLSLSALTTINTGSSASLSAAGSGSVLSVPALTAYNGGRGWSHMGFVHSLYGTLSATNGGTVLDGALTSLNSVSLPLDGTGTLAISQWTAFTDGQATITGGTYTFPNLANIGGSEFLASGGASVSLPAVTSFAGSGPGQGGFSADGAGSTINVPALTTFTGRSGLDAHFPNDILVATHGGTVLDGALTGLNSVQLDLDGTGTVTVGITIAGTSPGSYGQVYAYGTVNLNGARLQLAHAAATPVGSTFAIFNPEFNSVISGTFQGLPEGAVVTASDGTQFSVSYGGNTVTLTQLATIGPTITGFSPTNGPAGTAVTITGTKFTGATSVAFGGVAATAFTVDSDTQITATVPTGATTGPIGVTTSDGTAFSTITFTAPPTITGFSPDSGPVGSHMVITGTNFFLVSAVAFNGVASKFVVNSPTQITATVPGGATDGFITVTTPDGSASSATNFTVTAPPAHIVTGADAGGGPQVNIFDASTHKLVLSFFAYDPDFTGGVRVALGDVNGDGVPDVITAPGPGGGPDIHVYDGTTGQLLRQFWAYDRNFTGGVFVATGDVNGDGHADIICGADAGGGPNVTVFSGADGSRLLSFFPYDQHFSGGVRVGAGDINGDGQAEIITGAGAGGGPNVTIFHFAAGQAVELQSYFAYDARFTAGIYVSAGDVNGDGKAEVIVGAGAGGGPNLAVFNGVTGAELSSFFPYDPAFSGGVRVAGVVTSTGGKALVVSAPGPGGGPDLRIVDGQSGQMIDAFFAYDPKFTGGLFVAAGE